jgi:sugar phosphate isomerase/epimerase
MPLDKKVLELVGEGISTVDLYCFCPHDSLAVFGGASVESWPDLPSQELDPRKIAKRIAEIFHIAARRFRRTVDICGFASFLPDVSLPDKYSPEKSRRKETLKALRFLLELSAELRREGFSCRTIEIVGGHTIILADTRLDLGNPRLQYISPKECFKALEDSLKELVEYSAHIFPDNSGPLIAVEIEPGASKLLNTRVSMYKLADLIDQPPDRTNVIVKPQPLIRRPIVTVSNHQ